MSGIDGLGDFPRTDRITGRRTSRSSTGGSAFILPRDGDEIGDAGAVEGGFAAAAPVELGGILALQEVEPGDVGERQARRHGMLVLQNLAVLQGCLLGGAAPEGTLQRLRTLIAAMPPVQQPDLQHALQAVVLRARVELARWEQGSA